MTDKSTEATDFCNKICQLRKFWLFDRHQELRSSAIPMRRKTRGSCVVRLMIALGMKRLEQGPDVTVFQNQASGLTRSTDCGIHHGAG
jgi:hypothetical protein